MDYEILRGSDGTGQAVLAHVTANRLVGSTTLTVDSVDNWPQKFMATSGTVGSNGYLIPASIREFIGHLDNGNIIIDSWIAGFANDGHTIGQVVVIKQTAAWANLVADATGQMKSFINTNGDWRNIEVVANTPLKPNTVTALGHNMYQLQFNSVDLRPKLNKGNRIKAIRATAVGTQALDVEATSASFAQKLSPTGLNGITTQITVLAKIKVEDYQTANTIISRRSGNGGWGFRTQAAGKLEVYGGNSVQGFDVPQTYRIVPRGRWVDVAMTLDVANNISEAYINGEQLWVNYGGNPASSIDAVGDLKIGQGSVGENGDMIVSRVAVFSTRLTAAQIRQYQHNMTGVETGCVGYWKLEGNGTDSSANGNTLTLSGGAAYVDEHPYANRLETIDTLGTTEYGIVLTKPTYSGGNSTVVVFCPEGCGFPINNADVSSIQYSVADTPIGFPIETNRWRLLFHWWDTPGTNNGGSWVPLTGIEVRMPLGQWRSDSEMTTIGYHSNANSAFWHQTQWDFATPLATRTNQARSRQNSGTGGYLAEQHRHAEDWNILTHFQVLALYTVCTGTTGGTIQGYLDAGTVNWFELVPEALAG